MVLFATLAHLSVRSKPSAFDQTTQLAIAARIYFSPKNPHKSHPAIYLCDLHGGHLRKVTGFPKLNADWIELRWANSNRVQWQGISDDGQAVSGEYDIRTGRLQTKKLKTMVGEFRMQGSQFSDKGIITSADPSNPGRIEFNGEDGKCWTYTNPKGQQKIEPLFGSAVGMHFEPKTNRLWLLDWDHNSTTGTRFDVCTFDWHTHKVVPVIQDAMVFDFRFDRDIYAATESRGLSQYDKKRTVWTARPFVGNWKTGKSWFPLKGLVYSTGIAVRP